VNIDIVDALLFSAKDTSVDSYFALKKMKKQSPRIVRAGNRNDTSHRRYWYPVDIRFM